MTAEKLLHFPTKRPPRVVDIVFNGAQGHVKFSNGTPLEFDESSIESLRPYKCANEIQIHSIKVSKCFITPVAGGKSVWDDILSETSAINFYGIWDADSLTSILAQTPQLSKVSFTYWQCKDLARVLDAIKSNRICELSMHVQKDRQMSVMDGVKLLCERTRLERLILVFEIDFKRDIVSEFQTKLSDVLASGAQIMLLFGGENECIKSLKEHGYTLDRHIRMATNALYEPRSNKKYETYEVYQKNCFNATWLVGSRIGWCVSPLSTMTSSSEPNANVSDGLRWDEVKDGRLSPDKSKALNEKKEYDAWERFDGGVKCCELQYPAPSKQNVKKWKIPGWIDTKIQKLIYNGQLTEMLTSNGFYIVLDKIEDEAEFFATMSTTSRLTFICTTSDRRYTVTENLDMFLADVYHIEFIGVWYSEIIEKIATKFTPRMYALSIMQVEFHTKRPLIFIFNAMSDRVKQNLKVFHFDARATKDRSIGSLINAFWKHRQMKFEELIIISNQWAEPNATPRFPFKLLKHVEDCSGWRFEPNAGWFPGPNAGWLLEPNGSATTMVIENLSSIDYLQSPFYARPFPVMAPIAYPNRDAVNGLTRVMDGYYREFRNVQKEDSRHFYVVIPKGFNVSRC